jgi:hypothetical protein
VEIFVKNKTTDGINEPLRLCLTLSNEHDTLIENAIISFSGGQYFSKHAKLEPLPPGAKTDTCFELIPRLPRATFLDIPPKLSIMIQTEDDRVISELEHEFTFGSPALACPDSLHLVSNFIPSNLLYFFVPKWTLRES